MCSMTLSQSRYRFCLTLGLALILQACGGGGDDAPAPTPNADPKGYYNNTGTATVLAGTGNTQVSITDLQGMIYNNRLIMFSVAQGLSYYGTISISGNSYSGTVNAYDDGTLVATSAAVSGAIVQGSTVTGTLTGAGAGSGSFTLNYAATNSEVAALARVENMLAWEGVIGGGTTTGYMFNVNSTGNVLHHDQILSGVFSGCSMNGTISPVIGANLYSVSVTLTACSNAAVNATNYTGLATTRQKLAADDTLVWIVTNGTYSMAAEFDR